MSKPKSKAATTPAPAAAGATLENTTSYRDTGGAMVKTTTHAACAGKGCPECHGLGFVTSSAGRGPGLEL